MIGRCRWTPFAINGGRAKYWSGRQCASKAELQQKEPERLTPTLEPGALNVVLKGSGSRFPQGFLGNILQSLRNPQIDVNFDFRSWAIHNGAFRNLRAWSPTRILTTPDFRRTLFPDVLQVGLVASAITWYNGSLAAEVLRSLDTDGDGDVGAVELQAGIDAGLVEAHHILGTDFFITNDMLIMHTTLPFTLTSLALGMMLTFRTQNCNNRYTEARMQWGAMVNESRTLSSRILALVHSKGADEQARRSATHAVKCIMTFPHTLKYHLTVDGFCPDLEIKVSMTDAQVNAAKAVALRKELSAIWDYQNDQERAYVDRLLAPGIGSRPLHVLQEITEINAQVFQRALAKGGAGFETPESTYVFHSVARFQDVLGACERIYKTPIYTGYTRFTGRCVFIWTNMLPLALYPVLGPAGTVPTCMIVALFLYGLEDVGTRIEDPFDSLPLWQYCEGIDGSLKQMMAQHDALKDLHFHD